MPEEESPTCNNCLLPPQDGSKLRKCGGCASALYCGKECQKAAWPYHKEPCLRIAETARVFSRNDHEVQRFGYATSAAFTRAMDDFVDTHKWAFNTIVEVQALLKYGIHMDHLSISPQHRDIYLIQLSCAHGLELHRSQRNPASAFTVVRHGFISLAEYFRGDDPQDARTRAAFMQECTALHNLFYGHDTPIYAGVMPFMFEVPGIVPHVSRRVPIFRPTCLIPLDEVVVAALGDLTRLCEGSINTSLPLRNLEERRPHHAIPGRVERSSGKWSWTPLFEDWMLYHQGRAGCGWLEMLDGLRWPPAGLMNAYSNFHTTRDVGFAEW
ncbi:hypothetical protein TRAPUB_10017 [Trametes pubescens]|uniref:MYND-type domain-containing protein n=1 Tax=Trametes pubescens TaxID=154538 RepID=A0A1M2W0M4_TRAPU|nr:hypothetical protein TRAPUB_10017 [Trametes pubescens]